MRKPMKNIILHHLVNLLFLIISPTSAKSNASFCGKTSVESPFSLQPTISSPLSNMLLCNSQNLYFRTSLGLFRVSSIDYTAKILTISHSSCSSSLHFISPARFSAGFPSLPQPNSLLLLNCSTIQIPTYLMPKKCISHGCAALSEEEKEGRSPYTCLFVEDSEKLEMSFDPKTLNCSHYSRVYKGSRPLFDEKLELGTRISFEIPNHLPTICNECSKPNRSCGIGLRCICHPIECKDKVISIGLTIQPIEALFFSLLFSTLLMVA